MFDQFASWAETIVDRLGYVGVAFLVAVENIFPPIPSEVVLPLAGFVAGRGDASPALMIVAATVGSVVGAWALYLIAAAIGPLRLHSFVRRYGRWVGVTELDLERAEAWFDRRAAIALSVGRCVPLVRSIVSVPAGFRQVAPVRFTVLTAAGSAVWNSVLILAGAALGDQWEEVSDWVSRFQWLVLAVIVGLVAAYALHRWRRRRAAAAMEGELHIPPLDVREDHAGRDLEPRD